MRGNRTLLSTRSGPQANEFVSREATAPVVLPRGGLLVELPFSHRVGAVPRCETWDRVQRHAPRGTHGTRQPSENGNPGRSRNQSHSGWPSPCPPSLPSLPLLSWECQGRLTIVFGRRGAGRVRERRLLQRLRPSQGSLEYRNRCRASCDPGAHMFDRSIPRVLAPDATICQHTGASPQKRRRRRRRK